ncbi:acyltransferase [Clostridium sporogenes]|uniref:acyltransferase n=1 Tax=Clostridium sporogenes TaxID=1509 RepID=UPI0013D1E6F3|nr:DapH/DapD/GlmU-related protein [Clostridium sporogenes]NFP91581.1 acyltransferase [Clostridium sporogenes]
MHRILEGITRCLRLVLKNVFLNKISGAYIVPERVRRVLYRLFGMKIGKARIKPNCFFEGNSLDKVKIMDGVFINYGCFFSCNADVTIGKNSTIGFQVCFCTSTHELGDEKQRAGKSIGTPIHIGTGVWIGARAIILPGVKIGHGAVIASGAIVSKDCLPNKVYAGVPAVIVKELK